MHAVGALGAACASASLEAVSEPPQRKRHAKPPGKLADDVVGGTGSGMPKVGAPLFRLMEDRKLPSMKGAPGRGPAG